MPDKALIPAYFSHSYRATDRAVNEFFVDMLYQAGFTLTVDPKSAVLSPTQLEMMMRDSACFVGVVTRRPDERRYRCSPFAVYEYGLAIQARKPRLLFIEHGVSGRPFMDIDQRHVFDREALSTFTVPVDALRRLAEAGAPYAEQAQRTLGEVGLLLPTTPEFADVLTSIEALLDDAGYTPIRLDFAGLDSVGVAARLDELDYVIVESGEQTQQTWILPYLMGRFVPSIKLVRHQSDGSGPPVMPTLARDRALERASSSRRHAIWWSDPVELLGELALEINHLDRPRRRFRDADDGKAYFRSLDRANGPVFISNAWPDNGLAGELAQALQRYNIDFFHYQYRNTIPLAVSWQKRLLAKVDESRIFVALISNAYLGSEWCSREMDRAEELRRAGRLTMIPYFLDRSTGLDLSVQGAGLETLTTAERVARIVSDLQRALEDEARLRHRPTAVIAGDHRPVRPDIAVIAYSRQHHEVMRNLLEDAQPVLGTQEFPDSFSWSTGTITSDRKGRYRVVVALGDTRAGNSGDVLRATVDAFEPAAVVLLGPAHDVGPRGNGADVVVADRLFGFDQVGGRPVPRSGWTVHTDPAVVASARSVARSTAAVAIGPVACGNLTSPPSGQMNEELLAVWPDLAAVDTSLLLAVRAADEFREAHRLARLSSVWTIAEASGDDYRQATHGASVLAKIIAEGWPTPPATDEPERSGDGVDPRST